MRIEKYSFGTGDRFGREGTAQLAAIREIGRLGIPVVPVWNNSNREHTIIGSQPTDVRAEASAAMKKERYTGSYYGDADHINLTTVDRFAESSDFFTIDVASYIGIKPDRLSVESFVKHYRGYIGTISVPGIVKKLNVTREFLSTLAGNYLVAMDEVGRIY
ncbi:MAG: hypothetical protein EHM46_04850, partial [Bacteroidetes bacterium]